MIRVAVWSQKGGVGKSTVTALLGMSLRDMGKKVGLLDGRSPFVLISGKRMQSCGRVKQA